jgi:hypothetical protein
MSKVLLATLASWVEREKSEDPAQRPFFGLREAHLYPGLLLLAFGIGLTVGLALGAGYGAGAALIGMGAGLFRLGRKP